MTRALSAAQQHQFVKVDVCHSKFFDGSIEAMMRMGKEEMTI
jgi:hypothetical protein